MATSSNAMDLENDINNENGDVGSNDQNMDMECTDVGSLMPSSLSPDEEGQSIKKRKLANSEPNVISTLVKKQAVYESNNHASTSVDVGFVDSPKVVYSGASENSMDQDFMSDSVRPNAQLCSSPDMKNNQIRSTEVSKIGKLRREIELLQNKLQVCDNDAERLKLKMALAFNNGLLTMARRNLLGEQ